MSYGRQREEHYAEKRQREQPMPIEGTGRAIVDLVVEDLGQRMAKGIETYGRPLKANNGRDALWDAYEEALDLCCYLKQELEQRK